MANAITPLDEIKQNLTRMKPEFSEMLINTGIDPAKFLRVSIIAVQNNPSLLQCSRPSLYKAFTTCAKWGLVPDGQEAVIVPRKGEAVAIDMIEGILKQCRNSGELGCLDAQVVYEKDNFDSWTDEKGPHFTHKKFHGERGKPILTYAYALTKDGGFYFEEITEEQMNSIEKMAGTDYVWCGAFRDEMKRKSALRRLSKRLPKSTDLELTIQRHDSLFDLPESPVAPAQPTSSRLNSIIDTQVPPIYPLPEQGVSPEQPTDSVLTTEGVIAECKFKEGETKGKKWVKYGIKIGEQWYGTFDTKIYEACLDLKSHGSVLCNVEYTEDKFGRELLAIRAKSAEEMGIPI